MPHRSPTPNISDGEAKALFALLDAAEAEGRLLNSPAEQSWRKTKVRLAGGDADYEGEGASMWELVDKLDHSRALDGSWIRDRWRTLKIQIEWAKALTRDPFF